MEKKRCSLREHKELDAISYCHKCDIYMCNKCDKVHSGLCQKHQSNSLDKNTNKIFTGFCSIENHFDKLEYFCKDHNILCCAACIVKIKKKGNGQHTDCDVCIIEEIKDEKKKKLEENIKYLKDLSKIIESSINKLKIISENIKENKDSLKLKIQKIFTKIRNSINEREDELLLEVDNKYNKLFLGEEMIEACEKLPNKIKISLKKAEIKENEWNKENNINLIYNCINIENNINEINIINEKIEKCNKTNFEIKFNPEEENINSFLEKIKVFGKIIENTKLNFKFKKCPKNIKENRKYILNGEIQNIITKTGPDGWMGTICENELDKNLEVHKWKIKILKTKNKNIMVGVAPIDFDIYSSSYNTCGWYFHCKQLSLYSGPPYNYYNESTNLKNVKDEITIIMNIKKRTLKFIIDNEDKGDSYTNIPIDKPIFPAVLLPDTNDSVEILSS